MNLEENFLEKNILFQSIKNPYYFGAVVDYLDTKYFTNNSVCAIMRHILKYYKQYNKKPNLTEIRTLLIEESDQKHFKNILLEFKELDTEVDIDVLLEQTEQFLKEKSIIYAVREVVEEFEDLTHAEIAQRISDSCNLTIISDVGFVYFEDLDKHIAWLQQDHPKISTGFEFYDKKLGGGFSKDGRALYCWMGGTNSGKSMVLGNLAANCVRQNLCLPIISLEMDEQLYAQRMSCNFSKIEFEELKNEEEKFRKEIENLQKDNPEAKLILKEFPPGQLTVGGLDSYLSKLKKKGFDFDIVFLDYITLMRVVGVSNLYEAGKRLAEDIRALTYKYRVSFVTVIQANRGGVIGSPRLDNTSESMGIAHTVDFMASIWREEEDFETNTLRTGILKNRIGENFGTKMLELDNYLRIREVDNIYEEDTEDMNDAIKEQIEKLSNLEGFIDD